jgi:hypothetical protein
MDIETLYPLVTEAIRRAEVLEEIGASGTKDAYRDVSLLEERIAILLPTSDAEGVIARRGAVTAAISSQDYRRAETLAARFAAEAGLPAAAKAELTKMRAQASSAAARDDGAIAKRYPRASSRYGIEEILRFSREFRLQGAPLPIC